MRGRFPTTAIPLAFALPFALLWTAGCTNVPTTQHAPAPAQTAVAPAKPDAQARFDALVERYNAAQQEFSAKFRTVDDDAGRQELIQNRPGPEFVPEFESLANECKGSELAVKCWLQVAELYAGKGKENEPWRAVDVLLREYIGSPALVDLPGILSRLPQNFPRDERQESTLRALIEKSPERSVQAAAMYTLATRMQHDKAIDDTTRRAGRAMLEKLVAEYKGVKSSRGRDYSEIADAALFEMDHLQIGKVAPDFETTDENGQKFKLSDYRGKVVVVDFWGNW
jgi:hypothetical protein